MKFIKNKTTIISLVLLLAMGIFAGCSSDSESTASAATALQTYEYTSADLNDQYDENDLTATIVLDDDDTKITGTGIDYKNGILTISDEGTYFVNGTLSNGQIVVDVADTEKVHIILNNVNVTNDDAPAFYEKSSDKVILTLAEGSKNIFSDGSDYADTGDDAPDATMYASDDMSINGSGSLTVNGNYKNGIGSQDDLAVVSGTITVSAPNIAVKGRDVLAVKEPVLTVTSGKDGLKSNNDSDTEKGFVQIDGGTIDITAVNDGIQAETNLIINGGKIDVTTTGTDDTESRKALKATSQIAIKDGEFNIDSTDDAVHANGNITVDGGTFNIKTGDDGFHADYATVINDGTIKITECYEGIEGKSVDINGGNIDIVSSDDGVNAAGGSTDEEDTADSTDSNDNTNNTNNTDSTDSANNNDSTDNNNTAGNNGTAGTDDRQRPGNDNFGGDDGSMEYNEENYIKITGGKLTIVSSAGDCLDSNGDLYIEGGDINVSGPSSGPEGPLDANGSVYMNGGEFTGSGVTQMAETPSDSSSQNTLMMVSSTNVSSGTTIYITDDSGNVIAEHTPAADSQLIIFSNADIETGETYNVCSGSVENKLFSVTISDVNTIVDQTGETTQINEGGGPGGGGNPGGNPGSSTDGDRQQPSQ